MVLSDPPQGYEVPDTAFNASTFTTHPSCAPSNARWWEGARVNDGYAWCAGKYPDCGK